jgi:hypothetical protein
MIIANRRATSLTLNVNGLTYPTNDIFRTYSRWNAILLEHMRNIGHHLPNFISLTADIKTFKTGDLLVLQKASGENMSGVIVSVDTVVIAANITGPLYPFLLRTSFTDIFINVCAKALVSAAIIPNFENSYREKCKDKILIIYNCNLLCTKSDAEANATPNTVGNRDKYDTMGNFCPLSVHIITVKTGIHAFTTYVKVIPLSLSEVLLLKFAK